MSLTPLPPPGEKYIFFALPSMNGPLPAELKFKENTVADAPVMSRLIACRCFIHGARLRKYM